MGGDMNIDFMEPLSQAWQRMTKALFKPFDVGKWFVVGFTAFLSGLLDYGGGGGNGTTGIFDENDYDDERFFDLPDRIMRWIEDNPEWVALIIVGIILFFALFIVLTWLSSRGKFMFLDNVLHDQALIVKPWQEYKNLGNSLFLWRLTYGFIILVLFLSFFFYAFSAIYDMYIYDEIAENIMTLIGMGLLLLVLILITSYISLFLSDFVVPIMYKQTIKCMPAWSVFMSLLSQHAGYFLLYGILIFVLSILVVITVIILGLFTCCIGFILLILPYISSVVTLPISYTYRAFSVQFLEQFGTEFSLFPQGTEESTG
jgi:hypothetical protein